MRRILTSPIQSKIGSLDHHLICFLHIKYIPQDD